MTKAWAPPSLLVAFLIVLVILPAVMACSKPGVGRDGPSDTVYEFFKRFERFDTAGMTELTCSSQKGKLNTGLSIMQAFVGLGSLYGINVGEMKWEDPSVTTVRSTADQATVRVGGRMNFGLPIGSTPINDEISLRRENERWCLDDSPRASH